MIDVDGVDGVASGIRTVTVVLLGAVKVQLVLTRPDPTEIVLPNDRDKV